MKKFNSKILLAFILAFAMLISVVSVTAFAAEGTTVYLDPRDWNVDNARFAVYYWKNDTDSGWANMSDVGDGIFVADIPAGYMNIIFCRMNGDVLDNDWAEGVMWNQTVDIVISQSEDTFTITDPWAEKAYGEWASGSDIGGNAGGGSVDIPSADGISVFTVAGQAGLCGKEWDPSYSANDMTYNSGTGLYEKTFTGIAAGTYEFKVAANHAWDLSWGDPNGAGEYGTNCSLTLTEEKNVTVTFDPKTCAVSYVLSESTGPSEDAPSFELAEDTVVYVENVAGWNNVMVYYWGGYTTLSWPGINMDYDYDTGLYCATIPAGTTGIIFTDGNGTQTKDIVIMPTENNNYFVNDNLQGDFIRDPNYVEPVVPELDWLQEIALAILLFLRSIEEFFLGLFPAA